MSKYTWLLLLFVFVASAIGGISRVKRQYYSRMSYRNYGNPFVGPGVYRGVSFGK